MNTHTDVEEKISSMNGTRLIEQDETIPVFRGEIIVTIAELRNALIEMKEAGAREERERTWNEAKMKEFEADDYSDEKITEGERYLHMGDLAKILSPN